MGYGSHKLLQKPLSLLSVCRGSVLPFGKTLFQHASASGRAVPSLVPGSRRHPESRADSCSPSASCPLPLAADVAGVFRLCWLLLQGSKVTSVPITEAEVLALGMKRKLLGKPGVRPPPVPEQ